MSAQQLITQHIDLWTSTIKARKTQGRGSNKKRELYGIKKLRELILELAVRGKLVPQDASDEPASVLLERIAAEKAQLIKDKKIKKQKVLPEITDEEKQFGLPDGWEWQRLGELFDIVYGKGLPNSKLTDEGYLVFGANGIIGRYTEYLYKKRQLLISCRGAYSGKPNISPEYCYVTSNSLVLQSSWVCLSLKFFYYSLSIADKKKVITGSAQPQVTTTNLEPFLAVIPPLKEQHRIVAKVDELMALCDQLEQQTESSLDAHNLLVDTLLTTLTDAHDAKELSHNWARLANHFDTLITTDYAVEQLKQTILQLAVMGKLVPQNPNDEPASQLLKRIAAEKAQLIKDKKIKKQKPLLEITDEEKPFELPSGWEWVRLGDVYDFLNGYAFKSTWFTDTGVRLLRNINIGHGSTRWDESAHISNEQATEYERFKLVTGDIVVSLDRPIINTGFKYAIVDESDLPCLLLQRVAKFHSYADTIDTEYLSRWLETSTFMAAINPGRSNGVPHISTKQLEMTLFPVCTPIMQKRTIESINRLVALCDQLKFQLNHAQTTQLHLSNAVVENALTA